MVLTGPSRRRAAARIALAGLTALAVVLGGQTPGSAQLPAAPGAQPPAVPGYGQVDTPAIQVPGPLPKRSGSIPQVAPKAGSAARAALVNDQVSLKALIIGVGTDDFGIATWKATLDRVGAKYDVLDAATTTITTATLTTGSVGNYNAILLTNSMLLLPSFSSALDATEWNLLWNYELNFGVRQAALYTSYGTWPETYCLNGVSEGGVTGGTVLPASLTSAGAGVFDYLNPSAQIPVQESWVYKTSLVAGCNGQALLQDATGNVLAVKATTSGREKIALTFTSNVNLIQSDLLVYGLFEWATKGLFFGERKHHLNVDIDDWFNSADHYKEDGTVEYDPGFRVSGHDTVNLAAQQTALSTAHPKVGDFRFNLAYNGADIDTFAGDTCYPNGDETTLTSTTKCLKDSFRWINHTTNHPELNHTDYNTSLFEIQDNATRGANIGLNVPATILKTPEYSGLGVYNPNPDDDTSPPTDYGLTGSNQAFLDAAAFAGVTHVHGNMSFNSHKPANFNTSIVHPLKNSIKVVPDWPTNIAYHTTTPPEETHFYNSFYGPNGLFPYWPTNRTYQQILDYEAGVIGFQHVATGSIYSHTFHIANVRDYGSGNTLVTDWVDTILDKYEATFNVPLINSSWTGIASYTDARNAHFAALSANASAVYDRVAGTITVSVPNGGTVQVGGVATTVTNATTYGTAVTAPVTVAANGTPVVVAAAPRL
ncbi:Agd3-related carbohydrate-binding protein [Catenuloplanes indicus]|uniref:Agd3 CBM87 domain-containing protein n=1 Tax=Catenuloplanes indicus TaxID=137267 RepID=A0AAE3W7L6_9ACTN|nr:hypothetical protein [Catenuloplanes indicus]MDQ0371488.1 hypothetical protein [Catenuloplanes indicus]